MLGAPAVTPAPRGVAVRARLESAWGMEVFDHPGMTEVGAWGYECTAHAGVHLNQAEFAFEVIDPVSGEIKTL